MSSAPRSRDATLSDRGTIVALSGTRASTLVLIVTGLVVLLLGAIYEVRTERDALFPPIAFKDRTIGTRVQSAASCEALPHRGSQ